MKYILLVSLLGFGLFAAPLTYAQRKFIYSVAGIGGPYLETSAFQKQALLSLGGEGGILVNNHFILGGYGQSNVLATPLALGNTTYQVEYDQGGFWVGYRGPLTRRLALVADTRLGWATTTISNQSLTSRAQTSFAATPSMGLDIRLLPYVHVVVVGGYRLTAHQAVDAVRDENGLLIVPYQARDFNGLTGKVSFLFGSRK